MSCKYLFAALLFSFCSVTLAQDSRDGKLEGKLSRESLKEPVFRISKARIEPKQPDLPLGKLELKPAGEGEHPLDPSIRFAKAGLERIRANIKDYSCTLVKQERIGNELYPQEYMYAEVRNRKVENGKIVQPLSVYMYFLRPEKVKGREVIYVEGQNENKLVAHGSTPVERIVGAVQLDPTGAMAMKGNRYPITEVGLENLVVKLIEKAERDRQYGECTVSIKPGVKINDRGCTLMEVVHPTPRPHFDFNIARVYLDDELHLPVRYEAYTWPTRPNGQPELTECYTYLNLKVNVGLEDKNFTKERFRL
jgi:hypothetical protein